MSKIIFGQDLSRHPLHYFTLLCALLIGVWGIIWFRYNPRVQFAIIIYMSVSYVIWGIFHHKEHKDLHLRVVIEYVLLAALAVILFGFLLINS